MSRNGSSPIAPAAAFDACEESSATRRFLERIAGAHPPVPGAIHERDDMYEYNLRVLRGSRSCAAVLYFAKGWQIFQTIERLAACGFGSLARVDRMLDFASGFGRVTRFLTRTLEPRRIWVAEILEEAVSFQREYFGVEGALSGESPDRFHPPGTFSLVVAASFFSHVTPSRFSDWLAALLGCLDPDGLMLFSTLGPDLWKKPEEVGGRGSVFVAESESSRLDKNTYGTAYVSEDFVRNAVARAGNGRWTVRRFPRALCAFQDLYLVAPAGGGLLDFEPIYLPWGDVDRYRLSGGVLEIGAWMQTAEEGPWPDRVELRVNDRVVAAGSPRPTGERRFGWTCEIDPEVVGPDDVLTVTSRTGSGFENLIGLGTMRTHPPETR